jgi:hypothetical protein
MSDSWPEAHEVEELFQRLCRGDELALSDFLAAVLDPLVEHLRRWRHGVDDHARITAAEDAVLNLVHKPSSYDPAGRGLIGFLCMSAEGDLLNALEKEARHHANRKNSECVELAPDGRNAEVENTTDDLPSLDDPHFVAEIASFSATERVVYELMRAGERATAAFAQALGIGHLPPDEQARAVKRTKDRVIKRLQRARVRA